MSIYSALEINDPRMDSINSKQDEIINMLLSIDGNSLKYLKNPTKEQIEIAVQKNPTAIKYVSGNEFDEKLMYELLDKPYDCDHIANAIADMGIREFEKETFLRYFINKNIKDNIGAITAIIPTFQKLRFSTQLSLWKYIITKDNGNHPDLIHTMNLHGDLRDEVIKFALEVSVDYLESCESKYWTRELTEAFIKRYPQVVNKFTIETLCDNCDNSALKMILSKLPFFKRHSYLKRMKKYLKEKEIKDE